MKTLVKLVLGLVICGLALYGAYCLTCVESPASRGFRNAIQKFMEVK
jgi:hypothetical protein